MHGTVNSNFVQTHRIFDFKVDSEASRRAEQLCRTMQSDLIRFGEVACKTIFITAVLKIPWKLRLIFYFKI